jgi:hypothetical protein
MKQVLFRFWSPFSYKRFGTPLSVAYTIRILIRLYGAYTILYAYTILIRQVWQALYSRNLGAMPSRSRLVLSTGKSNASEFLTILSDSGADRHAVVET